ncbi:MAG: hypothetical protein FWH35_00315 [Treponema sp.]|nr:hypothetical protein [Treponema sp.]
MNKKIDGVTFEYKTAQWILTKQRDRFAIFCTNDVPEKHILANLESIQFFDGMIFQGDCINDIRCLSPILGSSTDNSNLYDRYYYGELENTSSSKTINKHCEPLFIGNNTDHSNVFGRYIYGELEEEGLSHIHRDVLGCEPLFIGFGSDLTAIGNNPVLCAQAVHGENYKSYKNAIGLVQVVLLGATQDLSTSFQDIFFVPQNAGILIDKRNEISFYSLVDKMYYPMAQEEWDYQFEKTRQICLKLLSKGNIQRGNITGGYDSRVTLALAIEAGVHKNIQFEVRGYPDHPDVIIAKQIADYYGLKLQHNEVAISENQNLNINQDKIMDKSFNDALHRIYKQSAMKKLHENWTLTQIQLETSSSDIYRMTANGSINEIFRGYLSLHKLLEKNKQNKIMNFDDRELLINDKIQKNILSENAYSILHDKLKKQFETYEDLYSYDLNFVQTRAPQFHAGLNNRIAFSIGMNTWLHRLSMIMAPELRVGGQINFKLIEKSAPELLYFPFTDKTWHYYAYIGYKNEEKIKQIQPCININKRPMPSETNIIKKMKFLFDKKIKINNSVLQIFNEKYLSGLINYAKNLTDSKKIISQNSETANYRINRLICIYGASLFLDDKELPIEQSINSCRFRIKNKMKTNIYSIPLNKYIMNSETVCRRGDLLFSCQPVFRASDHNHL